LHFSIRKYFSYQVASDEKFYNQSWFAAAACCFFLALVWLVFGQTLGYGFVNYDDDAYVYKNPLVTSGLTWRGMQLAFTSTHVSNWYPLTMISHMLDCQLFGLNPRGPHLVNVLLHSIAVLLLFLGLWRMTGRFWPSIFAIAVFAIHPLRAESVAWISDRKDLLSGVFFGLTLNAYLSYARQPTLGRYFIVAITYAVGLMTKTMLMTVPLVLLLLDYWPLRRLSLDRQSIVRVIGEKFPLFALAITSFVITVIVQTGVTHEIKDLSFPVRLGHAALSYLTYLRQMFWPAQLAVFYPYTSVGRVAPFLAIVFLVAISGWVLSVQRAYPYLVTGWFWYLIMLVPVIGLVQTGVHGHADRYTYLPHIGICLAATWLAVDLCKTRAGHSAAQAIGAVVLLGTLGWIAHKQTQYWRNGGTLWRHALLVTDNNYLAHNNLASFLKTGDEAIAHLEEAVRLQPGYGTAHHHLGRLFLNSREFDKAIEHLQKAAASHLSLADAWSGLGDAWLDKGNGREASRCYEHLLELDPESLTGLTGLGWILATSADPPLRNGARAVQLSTKAVELSHRQDPIALRTLAAAHAEAGQFEQASTIAGEALEIALKTSNSELARSLRLEIDLYRINLPLRDSRLGTSAISL
jgi:tetratricopeptide (TPR) repeat protein